MKPFNVFPYDSRIPFMRMGGFSIALSVLLVLVSLGAMAYNTVRDGSPFNFALDFTGGMVSEIRFDKPVDVDDVRARLDAAGFDGAQVQALRSRNDPLIPHPPQGGRTADSREQSQLNDRCAPQGPHALALPAHPRRG